MKDIDMAIIRVGMKATENSLTCYATITQRGGKGKKVILWQKKKVEKNVNDKTEKGLL